MRKYEKGKRITSVGEFERLVDYGQELFIIGFTTEGVTRHISFIQNLQYRFLKVIVIEKIGLWVAKPITRENKNDKVETDRH